MICPWVSATAFRSPVVPEVRTTRQTSLPFDCTTGAIFIGAPSPVTQDSSSAKRCAAGVNGCEVSPITASIFNPSGGSIPIDIVMIPGIISHVEALHELPGYTAFLRRLAGFARVIAFDKRGQGLSDRISGAPSLEERMDDIRAVMDAVGSQRATLAGFSEGAAMSIMFATTYPDRVSRLVTGLIRSSVTL